MTATAPPPRKQARAPAQVVWRPNPGSQTAFLSCPFLEVLYHGTRGNGKTAGLAVDFAQHVGHGFGEAWRGILFRQSYPELADVVAKTQALFPRAFPGARFNRARMEWSWPTGEVLLLRHMDTPQDYWSYHGHEYPWIGFEELANWKSGECYLVMFSCCRSSHPRVPRKIRSTSNPYGVGRHWIVDRFRLTGQWWKTVIITNAVDDAGNPEPPRCAIHGHVDENKPLLDAEPDYKGRISAAASNDAMRQAWLDGNWDIAAGGMFSDVWGRENDVPDFEIPQGWRIDRAFDWGSSKPFSVGWYAVSDGSPVRFRDGKEMRTIRGDIFRMREWYGWTGKANEGRRMLATDIARGIVERELAWGWRTPRTCRVQAGPADSSIFTVENGACIATDMQALIRVGTDTYPGIHWLAADKRPGSRKAGWEQVRKMLTNARSEQVGVPRENAALFVCGAQCPQFLRTVLTATRDPKDLDDIDTDCEDHIADEVRYRMRAVGQVVSGGRTVGMH